MSNTFLRSGLAALALAATVAPAPAPAPAPAANQTTQGNGYDYEFTSFSLYDTCDCKEYYGNRERVNFDCDVGQQNALARKDTVNLKSLAPRR
jgi:hypothetical protein